MRVWVIKQLTNLVSRGQTHSLCSAYRVIISYERVWYSSNSKVVLTPWAFSGWKWNTSSCHVTLWVVNKFLSLLTLSYQSAIWHGMMKINQVFHYHPEKAQDVRTALLFKLYQTLLQLGTYNYQLISAVRRVGLAIRDYWLRGVAAVLIASIYSSHWRM